MGACFESESLECEFEKKVLVFKRTWLAVRSLDEVNVVQFSALSKVLQGKLICNGRPLTEKRKSLFADKKTEQF